MLDDEKKKLALLKNFEVSLFSIANFGSNTVNYENTKYKKDASSLIDELIEIKSKIKQKQKDRPQASYPVKVINPKPVSSTKLFKFKGVGCNINFRQIEASVWDELIKIRLEEIEKKKKEVLRLKAIAAANNFETRKIASTHRKKYPLEKQLTYFQDCPYCDAELNNINAVLEHIIPVALGGRSTEKNLVWICNKCNSQKSDLTLTQYCKKNKLNREKIEGNLEWLQKIF